MGAFFIVHFQLKSILMISFQIIDPNEINQVIPLVYELNDSRIPHNILEDRFSEMINQNYECAVIKDDDIIVGVTGLWYCTRHYIGKTAEMDHVYILPDYRGKGVGEQFVNWINRYLKEKGCQSIELNTYVNNYASHKFYYNHGFEILGFHFLKKI